MQLNYMIWIVFFFKPFSLLYIHLIFYGPNSLDLERIIFYFYFVIGHGNDQLLRFRYRFYLLQ